MCPLKLFGDSPAWAWHCLGHGSWRKGRITHHPRWEKPLLVEMKEICGLFQQEERTGLELSTGHQDWTEERWSLWNWP